MFLNDNVLLKNFSAEHQRIKAHTLAKPSLFSGAAGNAQRELGGWSHVCWAGPAHPSPVMGPIITFFKACGLSLGQLQEVDKIAIAEPIAGRR